MEENKNNSDIKIEEIDNLQSSKNKIDDKNIKKIKIGNIMVFIISIIKIVMSLITIVFLLFFLELAKKFVSYYSTNSLANDIESLTIRIILIVLIGISLIPSIFMLIYSHKTMKEKKNIRTDGKVTAILAVVFGSIDVFISLLNLMNSKHILNELISLGIYSVLLAGGIIMLVGLSNIKKNLEKNK